MKYHFKVEKAEEGGFWASCVELPGCFAQGETLEELETSMQESLVLMLSEPEDSRALVPEPRKQIQGPNIATITVPASVAFSVRIRRERIQRNLSQRKMAAILGMENVSAYQRLESVRANPTLKTLARIKKVLPEISLDDVISA